jgi:hypothetical protein
LILHHFTAKCFTRSILAEGITRGVTPIKGAAKGATLLIVGTQWLTSEPEFNQDWCAQGDERTLPYDRTEVRFTVNINDGDERLFRWRDWRRQWKRLLLDNFDDSRFCDPSKWWIYEGGIEPDRFTGVTFKNAVTRDQFEPSPGETGRQGETA